MAGAEIDLIHFFLMFFILLYIKLTDCKLLFSHLFPFEWTPSDTYGKPFPKRLS
jgi:hypothetical protein